MVSSVCVTILCTQGRIVTHEEKERLLAKAATATVTKDGKFIAC